jgi:hypothetical protein
MVSAERVAETPAAASASASAASLRVETSPVPPADSNAVATVSAHDASFALAARYRR